MYDRYLAQDQEEFSAKSLDDKVWRFWQEKNRRNDIRKAALRLRVVKWSCIATLMTTAVFFSRIPPYQVAVKTALFVGALIVMIQGLRTGRYVFAALFAALLVLYNPLIPTFTFSGKWERLIVLLTVIPFVASLLFMRKTKRAASAF